MKTKTYISTTLLVIIFVISPLIAISPFLRFHGGHLLVASDNVGDPRFENTVIYIEEHNLFGARGFVLNKKNEQQFNWGGPLAPDTLFTTSIPNKNAEKLVFYPTDLDMSNLSRTYYRGYAGWGKMQLNYEILKKRWIVKDFDVSYVKDLIANAEYVQLAQ